MSKDHALEEVQTLFPRQNKVNAIDVFLTTHKKKHQKFNFGRDVRRDTFNLITADKAQYSERYFVGSELSLAVCEGYNEKYGLIALVAQMHQVTKNRSVGREIVRAFVKHAICVTSNHLSEYAEGSVLSGSNMILQNKDDFYVALFNPNAIRSQMRGRDRSKQAKIQRHMRRKGGVDNIRIDSNYSSNDFVTLCKENSLGAMETIIKDVLVLADRTTRDSAFRNIAFFFRFFSRPTNNAFYKNLNAVFLAKGGL